MIAPMIPASLSFRGRAARAFAAALSACTLIAAAQPAPPADSQAGDTPADDASPGGAQPAPARLQPNTMAARVAACTACHGAGGRAGPDGYYPRLAGKPQAYLFEQLLNFRDGRRSYRPMQYLLAGLPDDYLDEIAGYFAGEHLPYPAPAAATAPAAQREQGRRLVMEGDAARKLPACSACHGQALAGKAPAIPGLLGLPYDYLVSQIGAWRTGLRHAREPDCMAQVAERLTPDEIGAAAAWLSSQPVAQPYVPDPSDATPLPLECGSQSAALGGRR